MTILCLSKIINKHGYLVYSAGGPWLITDMRRGETIFEISPQFQDHVDTGIETEGSNLSGVNSRCSWEEPGDGSEDYCNEDDNFNLDNRRTSHAYNEDGLPLLSDFDSEQIRSTLTRGLSASRPGPFRRDDIDLDNQ